MASGPGRATAGGTAVPFAEPGCPKVQLRPARRWSMNGWLPGAPIGGLAPRRTLDMMKSAPVACTAFVAWCFLALCLWSGTAAAQDPRSEEHTSELQSLMRISYAVFCLKKKKPTNSRNTHDNTRIQAH